METSSANGPLRGPSPGNFSDRWSDKSGEGHGAPGHQEYDMTLPLDEQVGMMGMGSPLMDSSRVGPAGMSRGSTDIETGPGLGGIAGGGDGGGGRDGGGRRAAAGFGGRSNAPKDVREHVKAVIDQNKELKQPFVVRNLIWAYAATVVVVTLLSLAGQIALTIYINNSNSDALVINVSGRQRMLSQAMCKSALAILYTTLRGGAIGGPVNVTGTSIGNGTQGPVLSSLTKDHYSQMLSAKEELWHKSQVALVNGSDEMGLPATTDGKILQLFAQQRPYFDAIEAAVTAIEGLNVSALTPSSPSFKILADEIDVLMENEDYYLKLQDEITLQYQKTADYHLQFLEMLTWIFFACIVFTLLLETVFILWPVTRALQRLIDERFNLIRRSLESEAENRGVSILMMGYISHELKQPLQGLETHLDAAADYLQTLENSAVAAATSTAGAATAAAASAAAATAASSPMPAAAQQPGESVIAHRKTESVEGMEASVAAALLGGLGEGKALGEGDRGKCEDDQGKTGKARRGSGEGEDGEGLSLERAAVRGAVEHVEQARVCCGLISTVIGDIGNLRNIELGRMTLAVEEVDVTDMVQQVLSALAPKVPEQVRLRVEIDTAIESEHWRIDRHRTQQILLNLMDNAFRCTSQGKVVVRARLGQKPGTLRFEVEDSGGGHVGADDMQMSSGQFEPLMDSGGVIKEGTGNLSLYVVKLLAELQSGKFGVDVEEGVGSTFWVEIPASSDESRRGPGMAKGAIAADAAAAAAIGAQRSSSSGRVAPAAAGESQHGPAASSLSSAADRAVSGTGTSPY